jgi:hypothetical protein
MEFTEWTPIIACGHISVFSYSTLFDVCIVMFCDEAFSFEYKYQTLRSLFSVDRTAMPYDEENGGVPGIVLLLFSDIFSHAMGRKYHRLLGQCHNELLLFDDVNDRSLIIKSTFASLHAEVKGHCSNGCRE